MDEQQLLCCLECRQAENAWLEEIDATIETLAARPNAHGWLQCPGCGIRFSMTDARVFQNGRHWTCGQKISVVT